MRSNLTTEAAQEIYSQCGGAYDAYDSVGTKCFVNTESAAAVTGRGYGYGITADTGLQKRCRNFYNQIYKRIAQGVDYKGVATDARGVRICKVRWPVSAGGVLNAWLGADLPRHSPVAGSSFGLANMNSCALSLLFRANALETLIRDYGSSGNTGENSIGLGRLNELGATLTGLSVDTDSVRLICRYYRLAPNREVPVSYACKIWRPMISLGDAMPKASGAAAGAAVAASGINQFTDAGKATVFADSSRTYLMPSGRDFISLPAIAAGAVPNMATQFQIAKHENMWEVEWSNLSYPMLPSQLLICAPKDSFSFSHRQIVAANVIGGRSVLSRDSSLAIKQLEISVNTTERTYKYTRDASCFDDQNILLQDTLQNVQRGFFKGDFDAFRTRNHFVLLSSDQFCPIPQMSAGITSPVQITIRARFQNECCFVDGLCEVDGAALADGAITIADERHPQPTVSADLIRSRPVVVAFFQRSTLQIAPSSATVSVQSYSQSSGAEILAANR